MSDLKAIFSSFITDHLNSHKALPVKFEQIIQDAVFNLLDSEILIEDNLSANPALTAPKVNQALPSFEQTYVIDQLTEQVKSKGFGAHFHQIIGLFGSIMLQMTATAATSE